MAPLRSLVVMFALAALLATVKLVPMMQVMDRGGPSVVRKVEPVGGFEGHRLFDVADVDVRSRNFNADILAIGTWYAAPLLFVIACVALPRRMLGWLALLVLTLLLMYSGRVPVWVDLFALLHRLPVFKAVTNPFKYFNVFVLIIVCIGTAHALTWLGKRPGTRRSALVVVALVTVGGPFLWHVRVNYHLFSAEPVGPPVPRAKGFFSVLATDPRNADWNERAYRDYFFVHEGIGVLNWYDPMKLPCSAVPRFLVTYEYGFIDQYRTKSNEPDWRGEALLADGGGAAVREDTWTPLGFTVDVPVAESERLLVINQNYDRRWRASAGEVVSDRGDTGRLAVRVPPGVSKVRLRYRPTDHYLAAGVSALAWLGCAVVLILDRRRRCHKNNPAVDAPAGTG